MDAISITYAYKNMGQQEIRIMLNWYIAFHTKITTAWVNAKRKKKNPREIIGGVITQPAPMNHGPCNVKLKRSGLSLR